MGELPTALLHASAWADGQRPTLIETHSAWVFLREADVFKIKKPVSLGFLDFHTLEQREKACQAEVRLNRRLAPSVYLGVEAVVRRPDGQLAVASEGTLVDWAVHMVRLPDPDRADQLLARHALTAPQLEQLASHLAAFHLQARTDEHIASFGSAEAIAVNVEENFAQLSALPGLGVTPAHLGEVEAWQRQWLAAHAPALDERVRRGRVRDGHGDLRLEHVYLSERGDITIVDCIEFNERFRFADVCADLAFLSMDLAHAGRVDLAERLLAAYARAADDYDLYAVVDFYESYRACVRGKVAALQHTDAARRAMLLALAATRPSALRPQVVAVGGLIASGKSTIADRLGELLSAPVIDADRTRKHMLGVRPTQPLDERAWKGAYDVHFTEQVYDEVFRRAAVALASGRPVVLDASFRTQPLRERALQLAQAAEVDFHFVECQCGPEVCRARLEQRALSRGVSDGRLAIFDEFRAGYQPVTGWGAPRYLRVDTEQPLDETLAQIARDVPRWPSGLEA